MLVENCRVGPAAIAFGGLPKVPKIEQPLKAVDASLDDVDLLGELLLWSSHSPV
jgi:hypothetical protein